MPDVSRYGKPMDIANSTIREVVRRLYAPHCIKIQIGVYYRWLLMIRRLFKIV